VTAHGVATNSAAGSDLEGSSSPATLIVNNVLNRSKAMLLMHEDLARAHSSARFEELLRHERSRRVVRAHRAQRRAEEAALRARHLLSLVYDR
jgi:hypothetical protein